MFVKILGVVLLAVYVRAQGHGQGHATSYISFKQSHGLGSGGHEGGYGLGSDGHDGHYEHYNHPKYQYKYGVEDHHTGDFKSHEETRDGDVVKGSYSLLEPDGTILTVHYTADKHSGFKAVVHREGYAIHPHHYGHQHY